MTETDPPRLIAGYELHLTSMASPERYDVLKDGERIGYLRLRYGEFRADFVQGGRNVTVYRASPKGDRCFYDDERDHFLGRALHRFEWIHHAIESNAENDPRIEAVAHAWASIDGKLGDFLRERGKLLAYDDPTFTGHYIGYMAEADELIARLNKLGFDVAPRPKPTP